MGERWVWANIPTLNHLCVDRIHHQDAYAPALLAFACIRLLILLVPLSLALRPYWSYKGKSDKARRYGVLLAILFAVM